MKKIVQFSLLSALLSSAAFCAYALPSVAANDATIATIRSNLKNNLPDLAVEQILPTQINGIYEVDSGRKVFYVDSTGNFAMIGNLIDLTSKQSLTEQRSDALNRIDWNQLPLDLAIRRIKGNGNRARIAIFTDPDCPFCKRLEADTTSKLQDVTIYYFMFPLPIHPHAADHAKRILCSENPESAMLSFMAKDVPLGKNNTCHQAENLTKIKQIGVDVVQVSGTPTIILPNGRIVSGLVPADYLSQQIDANPADPSSLKERESATTALTHAAAADQSVAAQSTPVSK